MTTANIKNMTSDAINNAIAEAALVILNRWGTAGHSGILKMITTNFGIIHLTDEMLTITLPQSLVGGSIMTGNFTSKPFTIVSATGKPERTVNTLFILANHLATRDLVKETNEVNLRILSGIGLALGHKYLLSQLEELTNTLNTK